VKFIGRAEDNVYCHWHLHCDLKARLSHLGQRYLPHNIELKSGLKHTSYDTEKVHGEDVVWWEVAPVIAVVAVTLIWPVES
jgi:hypothetical protein